MLPLRDLLRELELEIAAGEAGLDRAVRWVHISELADPTPWLSGGELLLTTGLQLGDDAAARYVERLAEHGLTGLGLRRRLLARARCPDALLRGGRGARLPALRGPVRAAVHRDHREGVLAPRQRAVRGAAARAVRARAARADRALRARPRRRRGRAGGADRRPGADLRRRAASCWRGAADARSTARRRCRRELRERARAGARRGYVPGARSPPGALALPVARGRRSGRGDGPPPEAWLIAAKDAGPLNELDRLTLHQAVTIVALELLRRRVVDDTERRLAGDVLSALVAGDLAGAELARRLEPFGLRERAGALVLAPPRGARAAGRGGARARACARRPAAASSPPPGRFLCALLPAAGDDELFALAERLHARVARDGRRAAAGRRRAAPSRPASCGAASTRRAARSRRARSRSTAQRRRAGARHLPRPRLLPAAALAAGRRRAAAVLRLDPRPDRGVRGRLRRRADALAGGLHRVQRAVGARSEGALLPPSHAALPDPPRRGAHRALAGLARATASTSGSPCAGESWSRPKGTR